MLIGVLKEIKADEYRVGLTPDTTKILVKDGHDVMIEENAGAGSGFPDELYRKAGARIVKKEEIFNTAKLIIKVKEPQLSEIEMMKPLTIVFTFFHFASNPTMTEALVRKKITCIAYELIEEDGKRPILMPMSEIAGRLSIQQGMKYLEKPSGGKGILLTGLTGVKPGKVLILGGGVAGSSAADVASRLGAQITIIEKNEEKRKILKTLFPSGAILDSTTDNIIKESENADIIVGAVLIPGHRPPILLKRKDLGLLEKGTVLVDISIDEGGVFETSHPTTHRQPVFLVDDIVHYCVPNMPGVVPRTSTIALTNASIGFARLIADKGESVIENPVIKKGCAIMRGEILNQAIEEILKSRN